jgi:hypothetical protein
MENTSRQSKPVRISQKPLRPTIPLHGDEQLAGKKERTRSERDQHVMAILESTRRIRRRTDNREILAILDEIVWLARSI